MELKSEKIAFFLPSLNGGGAQRAMINIVRGFVERGNAVDLVLAKAEGPYLAEVPLEVRIVDLNAERVISSLPALVGYLRQERPKTMLSTMGHTCIVALWAKFLAGVPVRLVFRESTTISQSLLYSSPLRRYFWQRMIRWFYPLADGIVAPSRGVADDLIRFCKIPPESIKVIYNGVEIKKLKRQSEEPIEHRWFGDNDPLAKDQPIIVAAGRLTKVKDYPTLIHAFAKARRRCPCRLVILGEGRERTNLQALVRKLGVEPYVSMPGFVANPYAYIARASLFVLSSLYEGMPNALIEALAVGTPVIATDCISGPREILGGGRYGTLVPVGDADALAESILDVVLHRNFSLPDSGWLEEFSFNGSVDKYIEFLHAPA